MRLPVGELVSATSVPDTRQRETYKTKWRGCYDKARKLSGEMPFLLPALLHWRYSQIVFVSSKSKMVESWASKLRVNMVVSGEYHRRCSNGSEESKALKVYGAVTLKGILLPFT